MEKELNRNSEESVKNGKNQHSTNAQRETQEEKDKRYDEQRARDRKWNDEVKKRERQWMQEVRERERKREDEDRR